MDFQYITAIPDWQGLKTAGFRAIAYTHYPNLSLKGIGLPAAYRQHLAGDIGCVMGG